MPDDQPAAARDGAAVRVVLAGEQAQQRRLAGAVLADQADAGPGRGDEVDAVEDRARRELRRINSLTSQMLRYSAPKPATFTKINTHELLDHSLRLLEHQMSGRLITLKREYHAATADAITLLERHAGGLDRLAHPHADGDRRQAGGHAEALLRSRVARVDAPAVNLDGDPGERRDRVDDQQRVGVCDRGKRRDVVLDAR